MEKNNAPKIHRLLQGLNQLSKGKSEYLYVFEGSSTSCKVHMHLQKKLSLLSEISLQEICSRFDTNYTLAQGQLGKRSLEIVFSSDGQLVLKIATLSDVKKFEGMIDDYIKYLKDNPQSLLAPILRVFTVKTADLVVNDCFILMESVRPSTQHIAYDIKGLLAGRSVGCTSQHVFGKDVELLNSQYIMLLRMNSREMSHIWDNLKTDVKFLCRNSIMDYSLLISFFKRPPGRQMKGQVQLEDDSYCVLGIIDYLQQYNTMMRMTGALKGLFKQTEISTVGCEAYYQRMLEFTDKHMKLPKV